MIFYKREGFVEMTQRSLFKMNVLLSLHLQCHINQEKTEI